MAITKAVTSRVYILLDRDLVWIFQMVRTLNCPFVQFEKPLSRINIYGGATAPIPHM